MLQWQVKQDFKFVRLESADMIKSFDCGDADLNDFLLNQSRLFAKSLLSVSYAAVNPLNASEVYAYCSLANDRLSMGDFENKTEFNRFRKRRGFPQEKRLKSYPAVKLCRLAVDSSVKGRQIGTTLVDYIKSMFTIANKTGCRFITVDAYKAAIPFYEKNGFTFLNDQDANDPYTRLMYFDLMDIV